MSPPRRPDPEPMQTDDLRVVALGTALWLLALVATLVFHDRLATQDHGDWTWVAVCGVFLGFVGLRRIRRSRRAAGARPPRRK